MSPFHLPLSQVIQHGVASPLFKIIYSRYVYQFLRKGKSNHVYSNRETYVHTYRETNVCTLDSLKRRAAESNNRFSPVFHRIHSEKQTEPRVGCSLLLETCAGTHRWKGTTQISVFRRCRLAGAQPAGNSAVYRKLHSSSVHRLSSCGALTRYTTHVVHHAPPVYTPSKSVVHAQCSTLTSDELRAGGLRFSYRVGTKWRECVPVNIRGNNRPVIM